MKLLNKMKTLLTTVALSSTLVISSCGMDSSTNNIVDITENLRIWTISTSKISKNEREITKISRISPQVMMAESTRSEDDNVIIPAYTFMFLRENNAVTLGFEDIDLNKDYKLYFYTVVKAKSSHWVNLELLESKDNKYDIIDTKDYETYVNDRHYDQIYEIEYNLPTEMLNTDKFTYSINIYMPEPYNISGLRIIEK